MLKVILNHDLLAENANQAEENRSILDANEVLAINLIGSPGAGKTLLLERTLEVLGEKVRIGVIEGDIATVRDAARIERYGIPVVQINTEGMCHLNARMVRRALCELPLHELDLIFIENVGNLVCPAAFDLGEHHKVAVMSVTEGSDKPLKYPRIFEKASAVVVNKSDLLRYTDFDFNECKTELLQINSTLNVFLVSSTTGANLHLWVDWCSETIVR